MRRAKKFRLYASVCGTRKSFPTENAKVGNRWGNHRAADHYWTSATPVPPPPPLPLKGVRGGERWWGGPVSEWGTKALHLLGWGGGGWGRRTQ
jgi:hypothetical protein